MNGTQTVCYIHVSSQNEYLTGQLQEKTKKEKPRQCLRRGSDQKKYIEISHRTEDSYLNRKEQ